MRNTVAKLVRFSVMAAMGGMISFAILSSNCGGSSGQRTGTAGTTGSAGAGAAGTTGGGGTTGQAGVNGGGGAAGKYMCTAKPDLTCGASAIHLPDGHVTDFSMSEWTPSNGHYCNASGLQGSIYSYSGGPATDGGVMSSHDQGVDANAGNFRLTLTAGPGGYAGGGITFDGCVDVTQFNALRFSAVVMSGDISGCDFKAQLATFEQRPLTPLPAGGCDPDAGTGSCYRYPASPVLAVGTSATTFTTLFTDFTTAATHVNPIPGQLVGLQWQLESKAPSDPDGGAQPSCTVELRIDDIAFVTQ